MTSLNRKIVSIAIATYNGQDYLREQLDSILQQTVLPDEIVVSDDGSTDGTVDLIREYLGKFPNISLCHNTEHHGAEGNFANAFKHCKGDIIFPSDQDDIWETNKIETMLAAFTDDVEVVYAQDEIFDDTGVVGKTSWSIPILQKAMWKNTLAGHACAFRKSILSKYKPTRKLSWDYEICLYGSVNTNKVVGIPDILVHWRRHSKTLTSHKERSHLDIPPSKYEKLWYALRNCSNEYSIPFYEYMQARCNFVKSIGGGKCLIINLLSRQTSVLLLSACILFAISEMFCFRSKSLKDFVGHCLWAFCYPAVFWCEVHREKWIT